MKVFRKKLYMKDQNRTEEQCENLRWPVLCDGAQVSYRRIQGKDGQTYEADASWCEEVTSLDCQSDIDSMKDWPIGTEHVVRMNGKDVRVVVCSVHTSDMLDYKGCNDCALHGPCGGKVPCCAYERTNKDPVYFEHAESQKGTDKELVLKMHFSPEYNITFTEHNVNPDVGFETGKYYRFIGKKAIGLMRLSEMLKVLDNKVHKCTNGTGRSANFEGIGDDFNSVMFTWINRGFESEEFKYWKEMRPLVVVQAPDIITFDELCTFNGGSITGELPSSFSGLFDALTGRERVEQNIKEITKMKVDKHFAFKKKFFGTTLHEPKVVKTHKTYANEGACEACGAIINKGDFVLTANETDCNKVTKKTHRLCASCTADYIKATSYTMEIIRESEHTYKPITGFETGKWYVCHLKERPSTWNPDGKMDRLLDGKPHKCIMGSKTYASFEHMPLHREGCWSFCNTIGYFEEVPSPVKSYSERQAEWVRDNNVKVGTKVRVTRSFTTHEDGCKIPNTDAKNSFIGDDCEVLIIGNDGLCIRSNAKYDWWYFPYFVLEVVPEEPWFKIGDKVRITIKSSEVHNKIGTVTNIHMHKDGTQTVYMSFEEYWDTKAFNADSKEKIGVLYTPTYEERQAEWIKKHNIKEGDKIAILRTAKDDENGWENSWNESMTKMVGHVFEYREEHWDGIKLSCGYRWPYFVLGVVKE